MRITVIGRKGLIGARLVRKFRARGHEVVASARATRAGFFTGEGMYSAIAPTRVHDWRVADLGSEAVA